MHACWGGSHAVNSRNTKIKWQSTFASVVCVEYWSPSIWEIGLDCDINDCIDFRFYSG